MSSGLDEFVRVKTGTFLAPSVAFGYLTDVVIEMLMNIFGVPAPVDHLASALDVDRSWLSVESESLPVPKLESEEVRSRADLEYHAFCAAAVFCSARDKDVVVLLCRNLVGIFVCIEDDLASLGLSQVFDHLVLVDAGLEAYIYMCTFAGVEQIIALILSV